MTPNAFALSTGRVDRRTSGFGLFDELGKLVPHGDVSGDTFVSQPPDGKRRAPRKAEVLEGPVLFAGGADKQFGYFLTSGLGRLWALEDLPPETRLFYALRPQKKQPAYGFVAPVLSSLGIENEVILSDRPHRFERLFTASEIFGERWGGTGRAEFYAWLDARWPAQDAPDPACKLYVTRSGMDGIYGRFACEDHLEELLKADGYEIFAPEQHSVEEQVARYQAAGKLIFSEGSALHLFGLVKRPEQTFAVIQRRPDIPRLMHRQLADRDGEKLIAINAIGDVLYPPRRGAHLSLSVLDFDRLKTALVDATLVSPDADWAAPSEAQLAASKRVGLAEDEDLLTREGYEAMLVDIRARRAARLAAKAPAGDA